MQIRLVVAAAAAILAASLAGCAQDQMHSTEMGAGPATGTVCKDGTVLPPNSKCKVHGGVSDTQH